MPDYPTAVPAAGWYTDPSNSAQERWWGGVEWTHDVRPLPAPVAAPQPVLANVPGGGINPFAAIDAHEATLAAGGGFGSASPSTPSSGFSPFDPYDTGSASAAPTDVNASWYDTSRRAGPQPDATNHLATAGLVLSLIGANVVGIILSILALRKARRLEDDGDAPVGRKRARWGLGLGIASFIISIALLATYLFAFQYFWGLFLQQSSSGVTQTEDSGGIVLDPQLPPVSSDEGNDGSYLRADYEQAIRAEYAEDGYPAPDSVVCPDAGSTAAGSTIICEITTGDVVETRTAEYYENGGYSISTVTG